MRRPLAARALAFAALLAGCFQDRSGDVIGVDGAVDRVAVDDLSKPDVTVDAPDVVAMPDATTPRDATVDDASDVADVADSVEVVDARPGCLADESLCPATQHCDPTGLCVPGCRGDEGCARGATSDAGVSLTGRCDTARHVCLECAGDDECPVRTICAEGLCVPGCNERRGCSVGETCCDHVCVDTTSDTAHCGTCGTRCAYANAAAVCGMGACALGACNEGYADCDRAADNGCEADLRVDPMRCGRCDMRCPEIPNAATVACSAGRCGFTCGADHADCNGAAVDGCEAALTTDADHCGACATRCAAGAHARVPVCAGGRCGLRCDGGYGDCDGDLANGCETDVTTAVAHCGACGMACPARAHATSTCAMGACGIACDAGFGDCDGDATNGCETDLSSAVAHCGACGHACSVPGGAPACVGGACQIATCGASFADCDGMTTNGCETDLRSAAASCGMCGRACPARPHAPPSCAMGACALACDAGYGDCDGDASNGCEVSTATTATSCGACGRACVTPRGTAGCAGGECTVASCEAGYGDCDRGAANGCETNLATDTANCGACGARPREACDGRDNTCDGVVDEGCPTTLRGFDTIDFTSPTWGSGGSPSTVTCPAGQVAHGFSGRVSSYVTQLTLNCAPARLVEDRTVTPFRYTVALDAAADVGSVGTASGTAWTYRCPGDTVVGRVAGTYSGVVFTSFRFECDTIAVTGDPASGFRVTRTPGGFSPTYGGATGTTFDYACPNDTAGYGSFVRAVTGAPYPRFLYLTSVSMRCTSPSLTFR